MQFLSSKNNATIKLLKSLFSQKKAREDHGLFPLEGARLIKDATNSQVQMTTGFATKQAMKTYPEEYMALQNNTEDMYEISEDVAHWVADTKNPQGLFAVCEMKNIKKEMDISSSGRYLLLDHVQDPGNMGTLIRTALSLGIDGCFVSVDSVEVFSPKVLRSSMGAVLKLPLQLVEDMPYMVKHLQSKNITVYAAALEQNSIPLSPRLFATPTAVVIGNEGKGVSSPVLQVVDSSVIIPMEQGAESLNASIAGGIFLWEMNQGRIWEKE